MNTTTTDASITLSQYIQRVKHATDDRERMELFPFKRLFYSDDEIRNMMEKLKAFRTTGEWQQRVIPYRFKFNNIPLRDQTILIDGRKQNLLITSRLNDYEDWNILSDMFSEMNRLKAKLIFKNTSPWLYFFSPGGIDSLVADKSRFPDSPDNTFMDINTLKSLREALYACKYECTSFRPSNVVVVKEMFGATKLLDFSSGWGDRLIGAIACDIEYVGIDPNTALQPCYDAIRSFFGVGVDKYKTFVGKAQDINVLLRDEDGFDCVFTSPPYFNYEIYDATSTSQSSVYKTEDMWVDHFLKPSLAGAWGKLCTGGHFIININQSNKNQTFVRKMLDFMASTFSDAMYLGVFAYANERIVNPQPIFVWKKTEVYGTPLLYIFDKAKIIYLHASRLADGKAHPHPSTPLEKLNYDHILIAKHEVENELVNFIVEREYVGDIKQRQETKNMILPPS